jgi:GntR family transcriptional regulator, transcriptional repressor for pyruvate dehydrogenase complex
MSPDGQLLPLQRKNVSERVAETLREYIQENLQPGDRLPPERALCQRLGVGRTTLREGLRILESERRVTVRAGSGAYVTVPHESSPFAAWPQRLDATVEELLQVRLLLEPAAAAVAATADRLPAEKQLALQPALDAMERASGEGQLERRVEADLVFHMAVAKLGENVVLVTVLERIAELLAESRRVSLSFPRRVATVHAAHSRICDAIVAGQPEQAAREMIVHLAAFGRDMGLGMRNVLMPADPMQPVKIDELLDRYRGDESAAEEGAAASAEGVDVRGVDSRG